MVKTSGKALILSMNCESIFIFLRTLMIMLYKARFITTNNVILP